MSDSLSSQPRRVTADDIYAIVLVNDARISPDGTTVAYVQTRLDREANDYRSSVYLVPATGGSARRFTSGGDQDTMPRWSPRGDQLAFLSNRGGSKQVWAIALDGGEARQLSDLPEPVTFFAWSPDGSMIAVVSKAETDQAPQPDEPEERDDVVHLSRTRYRAEGTPGFLDNKPTHIWCVAAEGGSARRLTGGDFVDAQPAWSPDGATIAFVSNRTEQREYNGAQEIWAVSLEGGEPRRILGGESASFSRPVWSPDGSQLAVQGNNDVLSGGGTNSDLWLVPAAGGEPRNLTASLDRWVGDMTLSDTFATAELESCWSPDGSSILFPLASEGSVGIRRVSVADGRIETVVEGDRRVLSFSQDQAGDRIAFAASTSLNPCDIYVYDDAGRDERRLTVVNDEFLRAVELSEPEPFRVSSGADDAAEIHGWIMRPAGYREGERFPWVLAIHGGPHNMYGNAYFHEFQLLAARGFGLVYCNPRGSQGYGQDFAGYTRGHWGEKDMPDLMAAVDEVIERGLADPDRLYVQGGSYGGYMTNWVVGHTDRFKAAVTQRSVSNMLSMYGTSDIGSTFGMFETGGVLPWERPEDYLRISPISYVHQITTPLRIIHAEQDYRCPIEQAEQLYVSLKMLGREVDFIRFANENHNLSRGGKPKNRVRRLNYLVEWFESHP